MEEQNEILSSRYLTPYDNQLKDKKPKITASTEQQNSYNLKKTGTLKASESFQELTPERVGLKVRNIGESKYDKDMDASILMQDDYINAVNDYRSDQQGFFDTAGNLYSQFMGKTALNLIGGVTGFAYGIGSAIANKDASKIIDNNAYDKFNELDKSLTENMPVYVNTKASWYNPSKIGTTFVDTYSFIAGAVLTEMLTAGMGSAAVGAKGAQLLGKLTKVDDVLNGISKVGAATSKSKNLNAARQIVTGSFWESAIESNRVLKDVAQNSFDNFVKQNGRPPTEEEHQAMIDESVKAGFGTFAMNMGILNVSRATQFPAIFGTKFQGSKLMSKLTGNVADKEVAGLIDFSTGTAKRTAKTGITKFRDGAWKIMKNPLTEGVWEEGGQGIASKSMTNYFTTGYDKESIEKHGDLVNSFASAIDDQFGTSEGRMEMFIGALVGSIGAPGRGLVPGKYGRKQVITNADGTQSGGDRYDKWSGGIYGEFREAINKSMLADKYIEMQNNAPEKLGFAITEQVQAGVRASKINNDMAAAAQIEDEATFKTKKDDQVFNYSYVRLRTGQEEQLNAEIESIENMSPKEFKEQFDSEGTLFGGEVSDNDIKAHQAKVVRQTKDKIAEIKKGIKLVNDAMPSNPSIDYNPEYEAQKEIMVHAYSQAKFLGNRINEMANEADQLGASFKGSALKLFNESLEKSGFTYKDLENASKNKEKFDDRLSKLQKKLERLDPASGAYKKVVSQIQATENLKDKYSDKVEESLDSITSKNELEEIGTSEWIHSEGQLSSRMQELSQLEQRFNQLNDDLKSDLSTSINADRLHSISRDMIKLEEARKDFVNTFNRLMTVEGRTALSKELATKTKGVAESFEKAKADKDDFLSTYNNGEKISIKFENGTTENGTIVFNTAQSETFILTNKLDEVGRPISYSVAELLDMKRKGIVNSYSVQTTASKNEATEIVSNELKKEYAIGDTFTMNGDVIAPGLTPEALSEYNDKVAEINDAIKSKKLEKVKLLSDDNLFGVTKDNEVKEISTEEAEALSKIDDEISELLTKLKELDRTIPNRYLRRGYEVNGKVKIVYHKITGNKAEPDFTYESPSTDITSEDETLIHSNVDVPFHGEVVQYKEKEGVGTYLMKWEPPYFITNIQNKLESNTSGIIQYELTPQDSNQDRNLIVYKTDEHFDDIHKQVQSSAIGSGTNNKIEEKLITLDGKQYFAKPITYRDLSTAKKDKENLNKPKNYFVPIDMETNKPEKDSKWIDLDSPEGLEILENGSEGANDIVFMGETPFKLITISEKERKAADEFYLLVYGDKLIDDVWYQTKGKLSFKDGVYQIQDITATSKGGVKKSLPNIPVAASLIEYAPMKNTGEYFVSNKHNGQASVKITFGRKSGSTHVWKAYTSSAKLYRLNENGNITGRPFLIYKPEHHAKVIYSTKERAADLELASIESISGDEQFFAELRAQKMGNLSTNLLTTGGKHIERNSNGFDEYDAQGNVLYNSNKGQKEWFDFTSDKDAFKKIKSEYDDIKLQASHPNNDGNIVLTLVGKKKGSDKVEVIEINGSPKSTSLHTEEFADKTIFAEYEKQVKILIGNGLAKEDLLERLNTIKQNYKDFWDSLREDIIAKLNNKEEIYFGINDFTNGSLIYKQRIPIEINGKTINLRQRHGVIGRLVKDESDLNSLAKSLSIITDQSMGAGSVYVDVEGRNEKAKQPLKVRLLTRSVNQNEVNTIVGLMKEAFNSNEFNGSPIFRADSTFGLLDFMIKIGNNNKNRNTQISYKLNEGKIESITFGDNEITLTKDNLDNETLLKVEEFLLSNKIAHVNKKILNEFEGKIEIPIFDKTEDGNYEYSGDDLKYDTYANYLFQNEDPILSTDLIEMNDKGQIPLSQVNIKLDIQDPDKNNIHKLRLKEMDSIFSEIDGLINGKKSVKKDKVESKQKAKAAEEPNIDEEAEAKAIAEIESQEIPGESGGVKIEDKSASVLSMLRSKKQVAVVTEEQEGDIPEIEETESTIDEDSLIEEANNNPVFDIEADGKSFKLINTNVIGEKKESKYESKAVFSEDNEDPIDDASFRVKKIGKYKIENFDAFLAWMKQELPNVPVGIIHGLIKNKAWGMTVNGAITLSDQAALGTGFHEAYHIVELGILTPNQRTSLYNELRKLHGKNYSDKQASEILADGFMEYKLSDGKAKMGNDKVDSWFNQLYKFIKNFIGKLTGMPSKQLYSINEIFKAIDNGQFRNTKLKNGIKEVYKEAGIITDFEQLIANTVKIKELNSIMINRFINRIYNEGGDVMMYLNSSGTEFSKKIQSLLNSALEDKNDITKAQVNAIKDEGKLDEYAGMLADELGTYFNFKNKQAVEIIEDDPDDGKDDEHHAEATTGNFKLDIQISQIEKAPNELKIIATGIQDESMGVNSFNEYNIIPQATMINKIYKITNGSINPDEAFVKLIEASKNDKAILKFLNRWKRIDESKDPFITMAMKASLTLNHIDGKTILTDNGDARVVQSFEEKNKKKAFSEINMLYIQSEASKKETLIELMDYIEVEINKDSTRYKANTIGRFAEILNIDQMLGESEFATIYKEDKSKKIVNKIDTGLVYQFREAITKNYAKKNRLDDNTVSARWTTYPIQAPTDLNLMLDILGNKSRLSDLSQMFRLMIPDEAELTDASIVTASGKSMFSTTKQGEFTKTINIINNAYIIANIDKNSAENHGERAIRYLRDNLEFFDTLLDHDVSSSINGIMNIIKSGNPNNLRATNSIALGQTDSMDKDDSEATDKMAPTDIIVQQILLTISKQGDNVINETIVRLPADSGVMRSYNLQIGASGGTTSVNTMAQQLVYDVLESKRFDESFIYTLINEFGSKVNKSDLDSLELLMKEISVLANSTDEKNRSKALELYKSIYPKGGGRTTRKSEKTALTGLVNAFMQDNVNQTLELMEKYGLISIDGDKISNIALPKNLMDQYPDIRSMAMDLNKKWTGESIEQSYLFFGNLSEFKDPYKRFKSVATDGTMSDLSKKTLDFISSGKMNRNGVIIDNSADTLFEQVYKGNLTTPEGLQKIMDNANTFRYMSENGKKLFEEASNAAKSDAYKIMQRRFGHLDRKSLNIAIMSEQEIPSLFLSRLTKSIEKSAEDEYKFLSLTHKLKSKEEFIKEVVDSRLKSFKKQIIADGYATISPFSYRIQNVLSGKWNPTREFIYDKISKGKKIDYKEFLDFLGYDASSKKIENGNLVPSKPVMTGVVTEMKKFNVENDQFDTIKTDFGWSLFFGKLAIFPNIPVEIEGLPWDDTIASHLDKMMNRSSVDIALYPSGSKTEIARHNPEMVNNFANETEDGDGLDDGKRILNSIPIKWANHRLVLDVDPKEHSHIRIGSQQAPQIWTDLFDNGTPLDYMMNKIESFEADEASITKEEISKLWKEETDKESKSEIYRTKKEHDALYGEMQAIIKADLMKSLGVEQVGDNYEIADWKKFIIRLKDQIDSKTNPKNYSDAIFLDEATQELAIPLDANIVNEKIESILTAMVFNKVVKAETSGSMNVQSSSFIYHNAKEYIDLKKRLGDGSNPLNEEELLERIAKSKVLQSIDENGHLIHEVYMPAKYARDLGLTVAQANEMIRKGEFDPRLLNFMGYRIPTSGPNMLLALRIKEFLPDHFGDTVILPHDIVTSTGADYDIDKLNIFRPNYKVAKDKIAESKIRDSYMIGYRNSLIKELTKKQSESPSKIAEIDKKIIRFIDLLEAQDEAIKDEDVFKITTTLDIEFGSAYKAYLDYVDNDRRTTKRLEYIEYNKSEPTMEGIQNQLLQIKLATLKNRFVQLNLNTPNSVEILTKTAQSVAELKYGKGADYKNPKGRHATITFADELINRVKFQGGKIGTAISAIHGKVHVLLQHGNIKFLEDAVFNSEVMKDGDRYTFAHIWDADGNRVSDVNNQITTGNVDGAKNPFLSSMNYNAVSANIIHMLVNTGHSSEWVFKFMAQPIISDYINAVVVNSSLTYKNANLEKEKNDVLLKIALKYSKKYKNAFSIVSDMAKANLTNGNYSIKGLLDKELANPTAGNQIKFLETYMAYEEYAKEYSKLVNALKFDTLTPKNLDDAQYQIDSFNEVFNENKFEGIQILMDNTHIGHIKKNGSELATKMYDQLFLTRNKAISDPIVNEIKNKITNNGQYKIDSNTMRKIRNFVYTYIYQRAVNRKIFKSSTPFSPNQLKQLMDGKNSIANQLSTIVLENKNEEWVESNLFLSKYMLSLYDKFTDVYGIGTIISKPDINTSDQMTQSFNELEAINSDDLPIFDHIISLDAASNGFQNSYAGIHKQLPSKKIGEYIAVEINDLKQILDNPAKIRDYFGLNNDSVNSEVEFDSIIDNFYKKNHKANKIVPKIEGKNITMSDETLEFNPLIPLAFEIKTSQSYSARKYLKREIIIDGKKILTLYRNSGKISGEGKDEKVLFYLTPIKSPSYNLTEMHSNVNSIVNADKLNYIMSDRDLKNTARLLKSKLERLKEEKMVEVKPTETNKKLAESINTIPLQTNFSRESVKSDNKYMYLFTDNAGRTSGSNLIQDDSVYSKLYGKGGKYPGMTQAVVRGLNNAFPITTMVDDKRTQWTDDRFEEYKVIIDNEIENIKKYVGKYSGIKFAAQMPFGKGKISNMKYSAPKIFEYMNSKLMEIGIDNRGDTPKSIESTEKSKRSFKDLSPEQRLDMRNKYSEESLESLESWFNSKSYEQQQRILSCL